MKLRDLFKKKPAQPPAVTAPAAQPPAPVPRKVVHAEYPDVPILDR